MSTRNVLLIGGPLDGERKAVLTRAHEFVCVVTPRVGYHASSDSIPSYERVIYQIEPLHTDTAVFWVAFPTGTRLDDALVRLLNGYTPADEVKS